MSNYYYGQGRVWIAPVTDGVITGGYTEVGDADLLEITPSQEFLDIQESQSGNRQRVKHLEIGSNFSFNMQIKEITSENLQKAFYGTLTENVAAVSHTESVTGYNGAMTPLTYPNVSNVSVSVQGGGGPLVLDTDYSLDTKNGHIVILTGHTHVDLSGNGPWTLDVTYDYAANDLIKFAKSDLAHYAIRFEGKNVAEGGRAEIVTIHNVALNMSTTLSLIDTTENTLTVGGEALPDANDDTVTYVQTA